MWPGVSKGVLLCIKKYQNSIKDTSSSDVSKRVKTFGTFFDTAFGPDGMDGDDASR